MWIKDEDRMSKIKISQGSLKYMNGKYNSNYLRKLHESNPRPSLHEIERIARELGVTPRYVRGWFKNMNKNMNKNTTKDEDQDIIDYDYQNNTINETDISFFNDETITNDYHENHGDDDVIEIYDN